MTEPTNSNGLVRKVTHDKLAPVARLMGYTANGLRELIEEYRVTSEWQFIGMTRGTVDQPRERVNCRVLNPRRELNSRNQVVIRGRIEFSIGDDAYELAGDAKSARELRRQIAEGVARVGELKRGDMKVNPRFNSRPGQSADDGTGDDQGEQASQPMIITPVAPRGPHRFRSC